MEAFGPCFLTPCLHGCVPFPCLGKSSQEPCHQLPDVRFLPEAPLGKARTLEAGKPRRVGLVGRRPVTSLHDKKRRGLAAAFGVMTGFSLRCSLGCRAASAAVSGRHGCRRDCPLAVVDCPGWAVVRLGLAMGGCQRRAGVPGPVAVDCLGSAVAGYLDSKGGGFPAVAVDCPKAAEGDVPGSAAADGLAAEEDDGPDSAAAGSPDASPADAAAGAARMDGHTSNRGSDRTAGCGSNCPSTGRWRTRRSARRCARRNRPRSPAGSGRCIARTCRPPSRACPW